MTRGLLDKMTYPRGVASNTWLRVLDDGGAAARADPDAAGCIGESCWDKGERAVGGKGFRFTGGE